LPLFHRALRINGQRVVSGITHDDLRWRNAPAEREPCKTLRNVFGRWSRIGEWQKVKAQFAALLVIASPTSMT